MWELRERIGSLIADGFTTPLDPAVRRCLSHTWLLHNGVARIVCSLKDSEVTFEVIRAHLEELSSMTYLRDLRPAIDPIANEVYAMYAARARRADVTEDELDGLSNLVEDISPEQLKSGTYLDLALDETLPILLRLASYCCGPWPLDARAWPLVEEGIRSDNYKVCWRAADALRVRLKTSSRIAELSQHEADGGEFQEGKTAAVEIFPVLGETAAAVEPSIVRSTIQRLGSCTIPMRGRIV